jgi:hypothetical protein
VDEGYPISGVVSTNLTVVAVLFGPGIPNVFTMQGVKAGGPVTLTITYTDNTSETLSVTVS